jgi:hypothetical protein
MRQTVIGLIIGAVLAGMAPSVEAQEPVSGCGFVLAASAIPVTPAGPEEVTSRVRIIAQPDSPVAVTKVDFTGSKLDVVPGFFQWQPTYTLEVINRSNKPISNLLASVYVHSSTLSGVGDGGRWDQMLAPGARAELKVRGGRGHGGFRGEDVSVDVLIESVTFDGCTYRPSQALPALK